jgi:hypothetical protein
MKKFYEVTRQDAERHFAAVKRVAPTPIEVDARAYFSGAIVHICEQLTRERAMDVESPEFAKILGGMHQSPEAYFQWLEGVLAYQLMYLFVLEHEGETAWHQMSDGVASREAMPDRFDHWPAQQ